MCFYFDELADSIFILEMTQYDGHPVFRETHRHQFLHRHSYQCLHTDAVTSSFTDTQLPVPSHRCNVPSSFTDTWLLVPSHRCSHQFLHRNLVTTFTQVQTLVLSQRCLVTNTFSNTSSFTEVQLPMPSQSHQLLQKDAESPVPLQSPVPSQGCSHQYLPKTQKLESDQSFMVVGWNESARQQLLTQQV